MLANMGISYLGLNKLDKSIECYNELLLLLRARNAPEDKIQKIVRRRNILVQKLQSSKSLANVTSPEANALSTSSTVATTGTDGVAPRDVKVSLQTPSVEAEA